jgi:hypothetical protein
MCFDQENTDSGGGFYAREETNKSIEIAGENRNVSSGGKYTQTSNRKSSGIHS